MRFADLSVYELIAMAENLVTLLQGTQLSAIEPATRADIAAAIGNKPALAAELDAEAKRLQAQTKATFEKRDVVLRSIEAEARRAKTSLQAAYAPEEQFSLAMFPYPFNPRGTYVAKTPSNIAVIGLSNIGNKGTFVGNNRTGAVVYEIWRREGRGGKWLLRMWTKTQEFIDREVTLGTNYEYRVCAVASKNRSEFSNTGSLGSKSSPPYKGGVPEGRGGSL